MLKTDFHCCGSLPKNAQQKKHTPPHRQKYGRKARVRSAEKTSFSCRLKRYLVNY